MHCLLPASCTSSCHSSCSCSTAHPLAKQFPHQQPDTLKKFNACPLAGWWQRSKLNWKGQVEISEQSEPCCRHKVKRAMSSRAMRKLGQKGLKQKLLGKVRNQVCYFKDGPCSNINHSVARMRFAFGSAQDCRQFWTVSRGCIKQMQAALGTSHVQKQEGVQEKAKPTILIKGRNYITCFHR